MTKANDYYTSVQADRNAWKGEQRQACMHCLKEGELQVHEIERRSQAQGRWGHRSNYLYVCGECHDVSFAAMSHARQLALKLIRDPDHFDLDAWLRLKDEELRAPERVTLKDVVSNLELW